ncbi:MAG: 30S ribosomal protein S9 [Candidatus Marinimicrobia bacterium]|nr:30S ribosomal protein S9 [Candidatus Neomarinimicrobiota bacterium]|tara:strand:+ start:1570 stop:1974 length:405 start_codon:yes stop_codon:yes gene_type:complete
MTAKKNTDWRALGRRKSSVARVKISNGKGVYTINNRSIDDYFGGRDVLKMVTKQPLELLGVDGQYDIDVNVNGGGLSGQAGAIRLGISRVIQEINPDFRKSLKENGFLTRDSREVERKKPGQPGARKKFQFSKR